MKWVDEGFDEILGSPEMERVVEDVTEKIANTAIATAPEDSREYKNSVRVTTKRQKRVVGLVQVFDWKALIIEARLGVLVRAVRAVGRGRGR